MIVLVMAISNLVLTRQIYPEETNGAHAHCREPVFVFFRQFKNCRNLSIAARGQFAFFRFPVYIKHRHHAQYYPD